MFAKNCNNRINSTNRFKAFSFLSFRAVILLLFAESNFLIQLNSVGQHSNFKKIIFNQALDESDVSKSCSAGGGVLQSKFYLQKDVSFEKKICVFQGGSSHNMDCQCRIHYTYVYCISYLCTTQIIIKYKKHKMKKEEEKNGDGEC